MREPTRRATGRPRMTTPATARPADRRLRTYVESAAYLGISCKTLRMLVALKRIPSVRVSPRRVACDIADLDAYIARQRR